MKTRFGVENWMKEQWSEGKRIKLMWRSGAHQLNEEIWRRIGKKSIEEEEELRMLNEESAGCEQGR